MTANNFIETLNHFLATKNVEQIGRLVSDIGCFKSDSLGNGSLFFGAEAPSAIRLALNEYVKSNKKLTMEIIGRSGNQNAAVFIVKWKKKPKFSPSTVSLGVKGEKLIYFIETFSQKKK